MRFEWILGFSHITSESRRWSHAHASGSHCEAATVSSCQWHRKQEDSKVLISNGGFNLKWQLSTTAIIWKPLQWTPLINFVFWNGSRGSSKYISFIMIQRVNMWPSALLFYFVSQPLPSVRAQRDWKWRSHIKQVCQQNAHWHVLNRDMPPPLNRFIPFYLSLYAIQLSHPHTDTDSWC